MSTETHSTQTQCQKTLTSFVETQKQMVSREIDSCDTNYSIQLSIIEQYQKSMDKDTYTTLINQMTEAFKESGMKYQGIQSLCNELLDKINKQFSIQHEESNDLIQFNEELKKMHKEVTQREPDATEKQDIIRQLSVVVCGLYESLNKTSNNTSKTKELEEEKKKLRNEVQSTKLEKEMYINANKHLMIEKDEIIKQLEGQINKMKMNEAFNTRQKNKIAILNDEHKKEMDKMRDFYTKIIENYEMKANKHEEVEEVLIHNEKVGRKMISQYIDSDEQLTDEDHDNDKIEVHKDGDVVTITYKPNHPISCHSNTLVVTSSILCVYKKFNGEMELYKTVPLGCSIRLSGGEYIMKGFNGRFEDELFSIHFTN